MSISIQIRNNKYLELFSDEAFGLSYQVYDLGNIETSQGTFTNDFEIPDTAYNRDALGYATEANVLNAGSIRSKGIPASCYHHGSLISKGIIQINNKRRGKINITFYGENADVFALMRAKTLREIDLDHLKHQYNATNIINSFTNTSGYIYLPIDYGEFTTRSTNDIDVGEIYPAVYLNDIVKAIFRGIGYKVSGTLLNRALYKKSVVPFSNDTFEYDSKSFYADNGSGTFTISSGVTVRHNFTRLVDNFAGQENENDLFDLTSDRYTADENYQLNLAYGYDYRSLLLINGVSSITAPTLVIKKNGIDVPTTAAGRYITATVTVAPTDYIEAFVTNNDGNSILFGGAFYGYISGNRVLNSFIYPNLLLPDITQVDFIKWVLFRFSGVMTADLFGKTVYLNQFNDIRNNPSEDWSRKVDIGKDIDTDYSSILQYYGKKNVALYLNDDNDFKQTEFNLSNEFPFGSGMFELDNAFIQDKVDIYEAPFSGTFLIESFDTNKLLIPYIPKILPDGEENQPEPRVLTVYGNMNLTEFSNFTTLDILGTSVSSIPFSYFYKSTLGFEVDDYKESLAFGVQNVFAPNDVGSFEIDYSYLIGILRDPSVIRAYLKLNLIDLANLDHLKMKYIQRFGGCFYLNIIEEYDGSGDSVLCELIKLN